MGYVAHEAVLIETRNEHQDAALAAFRDSLPADWQRLVIGPVVPIVNGGGMWVFMPDGSKEGWDTSDEGDRYRLAFLAAAPADVASSVAVRFGLDVEEDGSGPVAVRGADYNPDWE